MPYPRTVGGKLLIMIPHQYTINDHRMQEEGTRHEFFDKFKDEFDYRYDRRQGTDDDERHLARLLKLADPYIDTFKQSSSTPKATKMFGSPAATTSRQARKYYESN
jgi:hypothetical protein